MSGNPLTRALRRLAPGRRARAGWRAGPWPAPSSTVGRALERFLLLDGGPVRLLVDDVLVTVSAGAVLRLQPDECRRLIVLDRGRKPVWLSFGPEPHDAEGGR